MPLYEKRPQTLEAFQWNFVGDGPLEQGVPVVQKLPRSQYLNFRTYHVCLCRQKPSLHGFFMHESKNPWEGEQEYILCVGDYVVRRSTHWHTSQNWETLSKESFEARWQIPPHAHLRYDNE